MSIEKMTFEQCKAAAKKRTTLKILIPGHAAIEAEPGETISELKRNAERIFKGENKPLFPHYSYMTIYKTITFELAGEMIDKEIKTMASARITLSKDGSRFVINWKNRNN